MEDQDKQYIKGFNVGYLLGKHDPQLLEQLLKTPNKEMNISKVWPKDRSNTIGKGFSIN